MMVRRRRECGVAALEFAITVPVFLALLGGVIYFGLLLYAKFVMVNAANAAVRTCVIKNAGYKNIGTYEECARRNFMAMVNTSSSGLCSRGVDNVTTKSDPIGPSNNNPGMMLLTLSFDCKVNSGSNLLNLANRGSTADMFTIPISSSMPYYLK
jgi:Flp pilus assembly protein TadG